MTLTPRQQLSLFIVLAFIIDYLPIINLPFLWSETFFHEISHGLAALLTGGTIHNITLNFNGSGVCTTSGGTRFLIAFSGYAGSALWGLLIYSIADTLSQAKAKLMVAIMVTMLALTLLLWARNISTIIILLILLLMYATPLYKSLWFRVKFFIQLVAVFIMLDAIRNPLYLLDGRDLGDGANLSKLTWLPEFFWVALWLVIAVGCLYFLWKAGDENETVERIE
ncbi:MAG TPA: M50 family peptidase [Cycloclasticus sp.]|nr:M50 family peptidase [Cycloclasticus sp.]